MNRISSLFALAGIFLVSIMAFTTASAVSVEPMTDAHIEKIRANCVEAQSSLNQLHSSDALLRVNRGQLYETISTKLMTPFNSRVLLNKLDGLTFVSLTTDYDRQLTEFRTNYQAYEEAMSLALELDCRKQPVAFYDSITDTRQKRQKTYEATQALSKTIADYESEIDSLSTKMKGSQ